MANLIILIISIGLLAAIAAASVWWGGDAFAGAGAEAKASEVINLGEQVAGFYDICEVNDPGADCSLSTPMYSQDLLEENDWPDVSFVETDGFQDLYSDNTGQKLVSYPADLSDAFCESLSEQANGVAQVLTKPSGTIYLDPGDSERAGCFEVSPGQRIWWYKIEG